MVHQYTAAPKRGMGLAYAPDHHLRWNIYVCASCGGIICAGAIVPAAYPPNQLFSLEAQWMVPELSGVLSDDIPPKAANFLTQARETLSSPSASVTMSASAVDAMLKARNYKDGSLYTRINQAQADHLLTEHMAEWAHDIRLDANDERHADYDAASATGEDAARCLEFAETLAELLFVLPARVKRGRAPPAVSAPLTASK